MSARSLRRPQPPADLRDLADRPTDFFSDAARDALPAARAFAVRFHHTQVQPAHLLLGVLEQPGALAGQLLDAFGLAPEVLSVELQRDLDLGSQLQVVAGALPLAETSQALVRAAIEEARTSAHSCVFSAHLLLGAFACGDPLVAAALERHALTIQDLRAEVRRALASGPSCESPGKARVLPPAENLLDRFTSRARRALALARAQAEEHGARSIQSGHLLAALVETEPQWGAVWTGADEPGLEALQRAVRMAVQAANEPAEPPAGEATAHLPRSELFMASLRRALQFADRERHPVVDLGHLLGGLCLLQDGSARAALGALGVEAPGVLARLGAYFDAPATRDTWAREVARRQAPRTLGKRGFTEAGALAVDRAKQVCLELRHNHLDTEHLLLGVLRVPTGEAALGLQRLGLDPETLVTRVGTYLRSADWNQTIRELPLTLLAREALELARGEARRLDRDRIGTAELLAGLLAVDDGLAAQVLIRSGMTLERWRNTLEQIAVAADPDAGPAVPESRSAVGGAWMKATIKWEGGSVELEFVECRVQAKGPDIGRMDLVAKKPLGLEWPSALAKALELFLRIKAAGEETEKKGLSHELPGNEIVVHYPGAVEGGEAKVPASVELLWTKYEGDRAKLGSVPCVKFVPDLAPEGAGCMGLLVAAATVGLATGVAAQHLL